MLDCDHEWFSPESEEDGNDATELRGSIPSKEMCENI